MKSIFILLLLLMTFQLSAARYDSSVVILSLYDHTGSGCQFPTERKRMSVRITDTDSCVYYMTSPFPSGTWTITNVIHYFLDNEGIPYLSYDSVNSQPLSKLVTSFDTANNTKVVITMQWDTTFNNWANQVRIDSTFDVSGRCTMILTSNYLSNQWRTVETVNYTYSVSGKISSSVINELDVLSGAVTQGNRVTYVYNVNDSLTVRLYETWDVSASTYINSSVDSFYYSGNILTDSITLFWSASAWENLSKVSFYYDLAGRDSAIKYFNGNLMVWIETFQILREYDSLNRLIRTRDQQWDTTHWTNTSQNYFEYDSTGNKIRDLMLLWSTGWDTLEQTHWSYNSLQPLNYDWLKEQWISVNNWLQVESGNYILDSITHSSYIFTNNLLSFTTNASKVEFDTSGFLYHDSATTCSAGGFGTYDDNYYYRPLQTSFATDHSIVCFSDTVIISFIISSDAPVTYSWTGDFTGSTPSSLTNSFIIDHAGYIVFTVIDTGMNISIDSIFMDILTALGPDTISCSQRLILRALPGYQYVWSDSTNADTLSVDQSGLYWVQLTDSNNCQIADSIDVTLLPEIQIDLGNDTILCNTASITLSPGNGFASYLWNNNSTDSALITLSILPEDTIPYAVTVIDSNGCSAYDSVGVIFVICQGVTEQNNDFINFTNPASGKIDIRLPEERTTWDIKIITLEGKIVFRSLVTSNCGEIDVSRISAGTYLFNIESESIRINKLIIIQ